MFCEEGNRIGCGNKGTGSCAGGRKAIKHPASGQGIGILTRTNRVQRAFIGSNTSLQLRSAFGGDREKSYRPQGTLRIWLLSFPVEVITTLRFRIQKARLIKR